LLGDENAAGNQYKANHREQTSNAAFCPKKHFHPPLQRSICFFAERTKTKFT
jgi:hypothetical protein